MSVSTGNQGPLKFIDRISATARAGNQLPKSLSALVVALAVLFGGCAADRERMRETQFARPPEPPSFLAGPAVILFSNLPPFGAQCRWERPSADPKHRVLEGALLHRENQLLLSVSSNDKKARGAELSWIWNVGQNSGFALNDALPGYAPLQSMSPAAKMENDQSSFAADKVNGYACRVEEVHLTGVDGQESRYRVWRAPELNGIPVRIMAIGGGPQFTLDLSEVRTDPPALALFEVPRDFKKYDTVKAMYDELFRRESYGRPRPVGRSLDDENTFEGQRQGPFRNY